MLRLKGLEDVIALSIVHPVWARTRPDEDEHCGWQFRAQSDAPVTNPVGKGSFSCEGCVVRLLSGTGGLASATAAGSVGAPASALPEALCLGAEALR